MQKTNASVLETTIQRIYNLHLHVKFDSKWIIRKWSSN